MSRETRRHLLVFSSSAKDDNESGSRFIIVLGCFASVAENDNKPPGSLSFSALISTSAENNDEPGGSLSSPDFFSSSVENDNDKLGS